MTATAEHPPLSGAGLLDDISGSEPSVVGSYSSRGPLACDDTHVEVMVADLRTGVGGRSRTPAEHRRALLELWLDVEPHLTDEERSSLGGRTFDAVFPDSGSPSPDRRGRAVGPTWGGPASRAPSTTTSPWWW